MTLRLYLSKKLAVELPGIQGYTNRVLELVQEYEQVAGGNLILHVIDPEPFSEEEDRAVGYGLRGVPLDAGNTQFYFGLVGANATDDRELIPFFQQSREEFLEYDLTKLVYRLGNPKQKVVGLLSTLPVDGGPQMPFPQAQGSAPWMIMDSIRELMEVKVLDKPSRKSPRTWMYSWSCIPSDSATRPSMPSTNSCCEAAAPWSLWIPTVKPTACCPIPKTPWACKRHAIPISAGYFDAWGIELVAEKWWAISPWPRKVNFQKQSRMMVADYPVWIDLTTRQLNAEDVVTAKLPNLTMARQGCFVKKEDSAIEWTPLIETDDQAMQIEAARLRMMPDVEGLLRDYRPGRRNPHVGRPPDRQGENRVSRRQAGSRGCGPPENTGDDKEAKQPPHLAESVDPINVIVVADTDMLQDRFWVQVQNFLGQRIGIPTSANNDFVTNALDNLTGSHDLISVRNRGSFSRPSRWSGPFNRKRKCSSVKKNKSCNNA